MPFACSLFPNTAFPSNQPQSIFLNLRQLRSLNLVFVILGKCLMTYAGQIRRKKYEKICVMAKVRSLKSKKQFTEDRCPVLLYK